ncbi:MAG: T9SS type A sorting domain-containing protein [Flavipsychrobacter sp.]|nr:T9SS type A sorting domain-containing protein [Flavipsychrobacter sp.]
MKKFFYLILAFISFTQISLAQPPCTGMPNAGGAFSSPQVHTCSGTSNLNLGGGTLGAGMLYQWESSTDGINWFALGAPQPMPASNTGTIFVTTMFRVVSICTNTNQSNTSAPTTVTINPGQQVTPIATITPSTGTTACIDDDIVFTSTITNGGSTPHYQWQVNGVNVGTNSNTYTALAGSLTTNDNVGLIVTSSEPCAVPQTALASVTMTILPLTTPTVAMTADQTDICETEVVTFNAIDNAPGGSYQWFRNGQPIGPNASTYSYMPANGDVVHVEFTPPAAGCFENITVTSNSMTINVTLGQPTLATASSVPEAVDGSTVTVYANLFNFSLNYSIDWYINTNYYTTTTVPYMMYTKGPGVDVIYAVANNSGGGCYLSDTTNTITISSIATSVGTVNGDRSVSIYPNPSTNTLKVVGLAKGDRLQLMNIVGQAALVREANSTEELLDVSELPAGNYLLNVHSADGSFKEVIHLTKN